MKFLIALLALASLSSFAQTSRELDLCFRAADKEAVKLTKRTNDIPRGDDYCQPTSQGQVDSANENIVIRNWVSCHYGQGRIVDVELKLTKGWFSRENVCKVRSSRIVSNY